MWSREIANCLKLWRAEEEVISKLSLQLKVAIFYEKEDVNFKADRRASMEKDKGQYKNISYWQITIILVQIKLSFDLLLELWETETFKT